MLSTTLVAKLLAGSDVDFMPTASREASPVSVGRFGRSCSEIHSGYTGTYSLSCTQGVLGADLLLCAESGCLATDTVAVTVGGTTTNVAAGEALAHGGSIAQLCENVNSVYTGTVTIECALGAVSLGAGSCEAEKRDTTCVCCTGFKMVKSKQ